jgi:cyclopropane fatty-acyl-phospholipid synthase-like methyltransferase
LLPQDLSAQILDLGCGLGQFLYFLKVQGYINHVGIDIGTEQVEFCRQQISSQVEQVTNSETYLLARECRFDAIVAIDVLEHLEDDELYNVLMAVKAALAPGGRFIVSVPNAACVTSLVTRYGDLTHCRLFTEGSLSQLFQTIGFVDLQMLPNEKKVIHSFHSRLGRWLWRQRERIARWIMAELYRHIMEGAIPRVATINLIGVGNKPRQKTDDVPANESTTYR